LRFVVPLEHSVKRYVLVFKNKLLSQRHTTFHIHYRGYKTSKEKHSAIAEKNRSLLNIHY